MNNIKLFVNNGIVVSNKIIQIFLQLLPPFQNVGRFNFSKFIVFAKHLDISYI